MPFAHGHTTTWRIILAAVLCGSLTAASRAETPTAPSRETSLRLGRYGSIVSIHKGLPTISGDVAAATGSTAASAPIIYPHPRPRLAGWSPYIAITTSDQRKPVAADDWEHTLHSSYTGSPLSGNASTDYIIGVLDTGAGVNLVVLATMIWLIGKVEFLKSLIIAAVFSAVLFVVGLALT